MPSTLTPTKTLDQTLFAWADVATANVTVGTAVDVSAKWAALVFVQLGRRSGSAFTAGWPNVRIEVSAESSGTDSWSPAVVFTPEVGSSIANTTLNGAVSAGASSFVVASATNIAAGDTLFLKGDTDAGNELVRVKSVSSTTITPEENVTNAHASGNAVTDQGVIFAPALIDLSAAARIRAVVDNANGGQTVAVQVKAVYLDSVGAT